MYIYVFFFTLKYYVSYCFVAKYVDTQLKSGNKEWSDEQLDRQLDRVMVLFRYIHGMRMHEFLWIADCFSLSLSLSLSLTYAGKDVF